MQYTANCSCSFITIELLSQRHCVSALDLGHDLVTQHDLRPGLGNLGINLHHQSSCLTGNGEILPSAGMTTNATQ